MPERPTQATQLALIQKDVENISKRVDLIYRGFFFLLAILITAFFGAVMKVILK